MIDFVIVIRTAMSSRNLLRCLPFNKSQFLMFSSTEQRIFEYKHFVVLFDLVEIIHIELDWSLNTCLTKEEKLECLKYLGKIYRVKETISSTTNPKSSLSQQIIFLFYGCLVLYCIPPKFSMFSARMMRLSLYYAQNFGAVSTASIIIYIINGQPWTIYQNSQIVFDQTRRTTRKGTRH